MCNFSNLLVRLRYIIHGLKVLGNIIGKIRYFKYKLTLNEFEFRGCRQRKDTR